MAGFDLSGAEVLGQESTLQRDKFIELLKKNGFRETETNGQGYISFQFKANDWLFVRAYKKYYSIHLTGDYDTYSVKRKEYDQSSQQPEQFMFNNILKNI